MSAKSFWEKAKANYWAGRKQDVYNIYDNAANMGNARSSYNRAATVAGAGRRQLEEGLTAANQSYKSRLAAEQKAQAAKDAREAYFKFMRDNPEPEYYDYENPADFYKANAEYNNSGNKKRARELYYTYVTTN